MAKSRIISLLGEDALALPAALDAALIANERAKYVFSLLQMAASHADDPGQLEENLKSERIACGLIETCLDRVVAETMGDGRGNYAFPEGKRLCQILEDALAAMVRPLALAHEPPAQVEHFQARIAGLGPVLAGLEQELVSGETITALTSGKPASGDSAHVLVMDLHKELNRLVGAVAEETIDGAKTFRLGPEDRPLIQAFMAGLSRTAPLKFDHPGLATTAMRAGDRLVIENDIGETEAHVLVVAIQGLNVTVTYSDVHVQRLRFFERMLSESGLQWEEMRPHQDSSLGADNLFYATVGRYSPEDEAGLRRCLEWIASRLVFLIDWNKARKSLRLLVSKELAIELLDWAADHSLGHRAFLQLGGADLVYDALETAACSPIRKGEPLAETMGRDAARDFLRFVLEATSTGLREGRSRSLMQDRIRVEVFNHIRSAEQQLLAGAMNHASVIMELARGLEAALKHDIQNYAERAKTLETRGDEIVKETRETVRRVAGTEIYRRTLEIADDAADALEEASYLAGLRTSLRTAETLPQSLLELAALATDGSAAYRRFLELAPGMHRGASREAIEAFLASADEVARIEHTTDAKEREVTSGLFTSDATDPRRLLLVSGIARQIEAAVDALLHASFVLRDHVLGDILFA